MKRGFTLIELLAVIVILAIIALIATPIVLSIIDETKDNATLRSAEFYLDAVEQSILMATLNNRKINGATYNIRADGNICLEYKDTKCIDELVIEVKGEKPNSGIITIEDGKITDINLNLSDKTITKNEEGELSFLELKYKIGEEITFNPGDTDRKWNVMYEDANTVTLILTENLGDTVAWYSDFADNSYGPKDALEYLNTLTVDWNNIEPIKNYTYINNLNGTTKLYGYQKIEIKDGKTTLTHKDGEIITEVAGVSKSRILTIEEFFELMYKTSEELKEENLRKFIGKYLLEENETIKSEGGEITITTVDELIALSVESEPSFKYMSKYMQTLFTYSLIIENSSDEIIQGISFPEFLTQNTYPSYAYWQLDTSNNSDRSAGFVGDDAKAGAGHVQNTSLHGVRPIITISKSKLKKQ